MAGLLYFYLVFRQIDRLIYPDGLHKVRHVADEQQRALIIIDRFGDHWYMAEVDMVGRLIEDQQSRLHQYQTGKGQ